MAGKWGVMIADDEPAARRGVRQLLSAYQDFRVVSECRNGSEVLRAIDEVRPSVIFLDVQMPGMDGFEVIRRHTPDRMPAVVFLTAYDQFALKAFDAQALDYLVKPVSESRFAATMKRVSRQLAGGTPGREPGLAVSTPRGTAIVRLHEIDWIESANNYSRIWVGARSYLLRESLNALEARIRAHGFVRAHRQALVRLGSLRELTRAGTDLFAVLGSGVRVPVSRRKKSALGKAIATGAS
jgi:two-component system, LytTR family, response regulator